MLRKGNINTIGFFFKENGEIRNGNQAREDGLKEVMQFEWRKVHKALLSKKVQGIQTRDLRQIETDFIPWFKTNWGELKGDDLTQKKILREIAKAVTYHPNDTQKKVGTLLDLEEEELARAFKRIKKDHMNRAMHDFQLKLLSGVLFTNKAYKRMGRKKSARCTFCEEEKQDFIHLYISCSGANKLRSGLAQCWLGEKMTTKRWFLGSSDHNDILEKSKEYVAKEVNHYIFQMNWAGKDISVKAFKDRVLAQEEVEEALAYETHKSFDFHEKWAHLKQLLQ